MFKITPNGLDARAIAEIVTGWQMNQGLNSPRGYLSPVNRNYREKSTECPSPSDKNQRGKSK